MSGPLLHRKCGCGGSCGSCRKDKLRRWSAPRQQSTSRVPPVVHDVLRSPGQPLDTATRMEMEPRFGHDFSRVRVHSGERAAQSAVAVDALAYAAGNHIVLGSRSLPREVMAHELAHVVQHGNAGSGDVLPQRVAAADSAAEVEADRAVASTAAVAGGHDGSLHRYRPKSAPNFNVDHPMMLEEQEFPKGSKQKLPWIETINISFDGTDIDTNNETIPIGTLDATYFANPASMGSITFDISGGSPSLGFTDVVTGNKVTRIEGVGYNNVAQVDGEGPGKRYAKPIAGVRNANMHYAIFFQGPQAIHGGALDGASHSCVHARPNDALARLNYHSVIGLTKVTTRYSPTVLEDICCERAKFRGATKKGEVPHPCNKTDPKACP